MLATVPAPRVLRALLLPLSVPVQAVPTLLPLSRPPRKAPALMHLVARLVCYLLLVCPVDPAPLVGPVEAYLPLRAELWTLALELELADPRETWLVHGTVLGYSMPILRARHRNLAGAPPLHDALAWPDRQLCCTLLAANRAHRNYLEAWRDMGGPDAESYRALIVETDRLYLVWDTVRDARCEYYHVTVRRAALARLRETIGVRNYHAGRLPAHLPLASLRRID